MGRHSSELRRLFETRMRNVLFGYRDTQDESLKTLVRRMYNALPGLFAFLEYEDVEPTNNSAERALRPVVLQNKISGQIKMTSSGRSLRHSPCRIAGQDKRPDQGRPGLDGQVRMAQHMHLDVEAAGQVHHG